MKCFRWFFFIICWTQIGLLEYYRDGGGEGDAWGTKPSSYVIREFNYHHPHHPDRHYHHYYISPSSLPSSSSSSSPPPGLRSAMWHFSRSAGPDFLSLSLATMPATSRTIRQWWRWWWWWQSWWCRWWWWRRSRRRQNEFSHFLIRWSLVLPLRVTVGLWKKRRWEF